MKEDDEKGEKNQRKITCVESDFCLIAFLVFMESLCNIY